MMNNLREKKNDTSILDHAVHGLKYRFLHINVHTLCNTYDNFNFLNICQFISINTSFYIIFRYCFLVFCIFSKLQKQKGNTQNAYYYYSFKNDVTNAV